MGRAPACRRQSQPMLYFFAPNLDDTVFVGEGKNGDKDHQEEGACREQGREGKRWAGREKDG